jgi:hypothetical protein
MPQGEVKTKVYMLENTLPFILGRRIWKKKEERQKKKEKFN